MQPESCDISLVLTSSLPQKDEGYLKECQQFFSQLPVTHEIIWTQTSAMISSLESTKGNFIFHLPGDQSIPLAQVIRGLEIFNHYRSEMFILGSRRHQDSKIFHKPPKLYWLADRTLNQWAENQLGWKHPDIFCPYWAITRPLWNQLKSKLRPSDLGPQLLALSTKGPADVYEQPVDWLAQKAKTPNPVKFYFKNLNELSQIRRQYPKL